ncbi:urease subunit alpha [Striga asiatica]|uniref:Urease subunit alpha n=1 Tax=Striga asiatica TaxID=4170 RepID=A0A5A7QPX3_STRAF|nr:urease subunit alpha [Striga asiatica]
MANSINKSTHRSAHQQSASTFGEEIVPNSARKKDGASEKSQAAGGCKEDNFGEATALEPWGIPRGGEDGRGRRIATGPSSMRESYWRPASFRPRPACLCKGSVGNSLASAALARANILLETLNTRRVRPARHLTQRPVRCKSIPARDPLNAR